jgi:hypothetical protein
MRSRFHVRCTHGISVRVHHPAVQIDDPIFADAEAGIERQLCGAVETDGAIRDFNQKQHIGGAGAVAGGVEIGAVPQNGKVGLRLVPLIQADGVLWGDDGAACAGR